MKEMKYITRILLIGFLMLGMVVLDAKVDVYAASMDIMVTPTEPANAGDNVSVRLQLNNNPGITTFGTSVAYDTSVLQYSGATWLTSISSDNSNMLLVSDVEENGQQKLNVSAVLNNVYSTSGETFVTLNFTARQAYSSIPITVSARDISDADYAPVDASVVMVKGNPSSGNSESENGGSGSESDNNNSEPSGSGNDDPGNGDDDPGNGDDDPDPDDGDDGDDDPDPDDGDDDPGSGSGNGGRNSETGSNAKPGSNGTGSKPSSSDKTGTSSGKKNLDSTYKTGAVDPKVIFAVIAVIFAAGAGGCMYYLRRRKI